MKIINFLQTKLGSIFPFLLFQIAQLGFVVAFVFGGINYATKSLIYIVPVILADIYLILPKIQINTNREQAKLGRLSFGNLILITVLFFLLSLYILVSYQTRPWAYFAVIGLISGLIFAQIKCERRVWSDYLIIFEIMLLSLDLIWGVSLKYPLYFGATDTLVHLNYINTIVQTGHINGIGIDYVNFPLFHIFNTIGVELTGLTVKNGLFIFVGLAWQVGIVFAYLIFRKLSDSRSLSLVSCLLFGLSPDLIYYGSYAVTRSLAFVIFLCWLYLILGKPNTKHIRPIESGVKVMMIPTSGYAELGIIFLSLISMSSLILMHHATVMFVIPIIIIIYVFQKLFTTDQSDRSQIQPIAVQLLIICFFLYLIYVAYPFSVPTLRAWVTAMSSSVSVTPSSSTPPSIFTAIYYSIALFFSLIGIGITIKDDKTVKSGRSFVAMALASLIFLLFYVPGPLNFIPKVQIALLYRIPLLVTPFIVFMVTYGLNHLMSIEQTLSQNIFKRPIAISPITLGLVMVLTFFSVISGSNANDNTYFLLKSNTGKEYFTDAELFSFTFIENNINHRSPLYGDLETTRNEFYLGDFSSKQVILGGDLSYIEKGYLIFRAGELHQTGGLNFSQGYRYSQQKVDSKTDILVNLSDKACIYTDREVQVYLIN